MKAEEILKLLEFNIPDGKTLEDLDINEVKTHFDKNFVGVMVAPEREEIKNKILGKERGSLATQLKNKLEELGVNFEGKQVKEGDRLMLDKVIEVGFPEAVNVLKTLKESANHTDDKKLNEALNKFEKLQKDYEVVLKERDSLNGAVKQKDSEFEMFKKQTVLSEKIKSAKQNIPFSEAANDLTKKGFDITFHEKYDIDLSDTNDSDDGLRIISKATQQRVSEGNKFVTFENLYKKELAEAKLLKVSDKQPDKKTQFSFNQDKNDNKVKINPLAEALANGQSI